MDESSKEKCSVCGKDFSYLEDEVNEYLEDFFCPECLAELIRSEKETMERLRNHDVQ